MIAGVGVSTIFTALLRGRRTNALTAAALTALSAVAIVRYGSPSVSRIECRFDDRFGRQTAAVLRSGATVIGGDYWRVWPAVFHVNLALARTNAHARVFSDASCDSPAVQDSTRYCASRVSVCSAEVGLIRAVDGFAVLNARRLCFSSEREDGCGACAKPRSKRFCTGSMPSSVARRSNKRRWNDQRPQCRIESPEPLPVVLRIRTEHVIIGASARVC